MTTSSSNHAVARASPPQSLRLYAPDRRLSATVSFKSCWQGLRYLPGAALCSLWCGRTPLISDFPLGGATGVASLDYALELRRVRRRSTLTPFGKGRELLLHLGRDQMEFKVAITLSSLGCTIRIPHQEGVASALPLWGAADIQWLPGAPLWPRLGFTPYGKLVAAWRTEDSQHLLCFERPSDLGICRFNLKSLEEPLTLDNGQSACHHLFATLPFTGVQPPNVRFGTAVTPSLQAAWKLLSGAAGSGDDFYMVRGELGDFAVAGRRFGGTWQIGSITAAAQTLTLRFEEFWQRTPPALRAHAYRVEIMRDPNARERANGAPSAIMERFDGMTPASRIMLDLAGGGGFLLTFRRIDDLPATCGDTENNR